MILDEPSSALDAFAEEELINTFNKAGIGKTIIYISHGLSIAKYADKVIFINNNIVKAFASHSELMENCQSYVDLYNAQAKYYKQEENK